MTLTAAGLVTLSAPGLSAAPPQAPHAPTDDDLAAAATRSDLLSPYLEDLDSPDFNVRESASQRLMADHRITDEDILDFLAANWQQVSPEQISRLEDAARQRFVANPGAIGVQFDSSGMAIIGSIQPQAPAYSVLRIGDRLLAINGRRLPEQRTAQQDALHDELSRCRAGDLIKVRVKRETQEIDVEFRLADARALPGFDAYLQTIAGRLQDRWLELCQTRLPPHPRLTIDMDILEDQAPPETTGQQPQPDNQAGNSINGSLPSLMPGTNALSARIRQRIGQISINIGQVVEAQQNASPGQERDQYQRRYLVLRNELARLNARLRLLDAAGSDQGRR